MTDIEDQLANWYKRGIRDGPVAIQALMTSALNEIKRLRLIAVAAQAGDDRAAREFAQKLVDDNKVLANEVADLRNENKKLHTLCSEWMIKNAALYKEISALRRATTIRGEK